MLPLRLCYLQLDCVFTKECYLPRSPYKDLTDTLVSGFNLSLVAKASSLQSPTDDEGKAIDECLLSIERNESDVVLLPYTMPVNMRNIKTGPVFFSDKIAMLSTYKVEKDDPNPGIFGTFDAFGVDALILILSFFVVLAAVISFTYILERKGMSRRSRITGRRFNLRFIPWFMLSFFVKQFASFPGKMTALKGLLTCCLLTFSYFVTFFYSSMIKTDMVTVKHPRVIASYQEVINDPQVHPYIRHTLDEYTSFKQAPEGSLKRKVWDRIVKMGVAKHVFGSEWSDEEMPFHHLQHPFMNTKGVIMGYSSLVHLMRYTLALYSKSLKDRKFLYVSDPTENARLSASVMNPMTLEVVSQNYEVRMRRFFEGHLWHKMLDNGGLLNAEYYANLLGLGKDFSDFDEFASTRVELPEPVLVKPNITYFMFLFISYLVLSFIQLIFFLIERWVSNKD